MEGDSASPGNQKKHQGPWHSVKQWKAAPSDSTPKWVRCAGGLNSEHGSPLPTSLTMFLLTELILEAHFGHGL